MEVGGHGVQVRSVGRMRIHEKWHWLMYPRNFSEEVPDPSTTMGHVTLVE